MIDNVFFLSSSELKKYTMQTRIVYQIIGYRANWEFSNTVIKILVEKNPNYRNDSNEKCRIDGFCANRETSFEGYYRLEQLYKSEYGEMSKELKDTVQKIADEYSKVALKGYGWTTKTESEVEKC